MIEDSILRFLNIRPHKNSGAMGEKWDGSNEEYLFEVKSTGTQQFIIKKNYWDKLSNSAKRRGKFPVMLIAWHDDNSLLPQDQVLVVMTLQDLANNLTDESVEFKDIKIK